MKTVIIVADSDPRKKTIGGIGIYSFNLTNYLTANNYNVIFIGKIQVGDEINSFDNFSFIPATKKTGASNIAFLIGLFNVSKLLNIPADAIIHAQRPDWILPFHKFKNKKIITLHGSHAKNVMLKKGNILGRIYSMMEYHGLNKCDEIVSVSHENEDYYRRKYVGKEKITKKITTIPLGIYLARFKGIDREKARGKYGVGPEDKVACYIGRLEAEKNIKVILRASKEASIKLLIFGDGRQKEELIKYSEEIGSNAAFMGSIANEEVPIALAASDCLCLSSLYEGLPTVAIEALASGIPVVSTKVGDMDKLIIESISGYFADESNYSEKLKLAIAKSKSMKEDCLNKASEYDMERIGNLITEMYAGR